MAFASVHPDLFQILRGYASLIPPKHLQFPSHLEAQAIHDFLVAHILTSAHFHAYPPSQQHQKSFWKWIIPHLEKKICADPDSELEVDSRVYEHYLELLTSSALFSSQAISRSVGAPGLTGQSPPPPSYITHFWSPENKVLPPNGSVNLGAYQTTTLLESRTMIEAGTTGLRTWLASLVLAQHLIRNPALVHRKRILELGSGTGFLGSVVASLQLLGPAPPGTLWMSDINDAVLSRCRDNVQLPCNSSSSHPDARCCFLDWSAALDPDGGIAPLTSLLYDEIDADLILGADLVFDPDLIPALVAVLYLAFQPGARPRCALVALTIRNPTTMQKFIETVSASGLVLETIHAQMDDRVFMEPVEGSGDANNGINIFRITRTSSRG
ncbi:hypothetical protein B0H17DRAFT_957118 [Mycena rosella]|uniref:Uncharacterized protein n=1 Tax=Mycena rosella TaxID=1033263 RepID=A0AAD7CMZ6_MYCRO|nr:hypothetical protein B0H17DRAFT_957118 [Mycena rosella]